MYLERGELVSFLQNVGSRLFCCNEFPQPDVSMSCFIGQLITTPITSLAIIVRLPLSDDRSRWKKHMNTSVAYGGGVYLSVCSFDPSSCVNISFF